MIRIIFYLHGMKQLLLACFVMVMVQSNAQNTTLPYRLARSAGKLPSLYDGLGDDRLGGTKLGYIDTNVVCRVIDSTTERYTVQLSKYHTAYIEKQYLRFDSVPRPKPFYLTNSIIAKGDTSVDYIGINMDERLPYKSWMEINPAKIMIDLYGVQSNTNWITQLKSLKEVKNIYYNQAEDDVVRVTIELQHKQHWGYSIEYKGHTLVIRVKRQPANLLINNLKIAIDAGHGGTNTGASGVRTGAEEKKYTLLFAKAFERYLKQRGVKKIIMTRTTDTTIEMKDRILFLQQQNPDILISFHLNSSDNKEVKGVSTYYKHIGFRPLTTAILKNMLLLNLDEFGNVGSFNFGLNAPADFPGSLIEIAFLSNEEDERRIIRPKFRDDVARKVYQGIVDWLKAIK
jgi:N-acetylmuramoyl-L-alanine amidase